MRICNLLVPISLFSAASGCGFNRITSALPTVRELPSASSNRHAECGYFYG